MLNGVQPGGHHNVILAFEEVAGRDGGREKIPRGRELPPPVTHGWGVAGDAVDVADVSLRPLAGVQPEPVNRLLAAAFVEERGGGRAKVIASPFP